MHSEKIVLVTGGSRGIGQAIALACAQKGMRLALCARTAQDLEETQALLERATGTKPLIASVDLSDGASITDFVDRTEREAGPVHGLVCAAGILGVVGGFDEGSFDEWEQAIRVNLFGAARCVRAVLPGMKQRRAGRVILFSGGGQGPLPRRTSYAASKGAIWRLTESLGAEVAPFGVYVNAIAPGAVNTRFLNDLIAAGPDRAGAAEYGEALKQRDAGGTSASRAADLALYLLSEKSTGLYGKVISAVWDKYREWRDLAAISESDRYTMKRIVLADGRTRE